MVEHESNIIAQIESEFSNPSTPSFEMDISKDIPEPQYLLQIGSVKTLPLGDIACIGGRAKAGKTFVTSILASALLSGECMGIKSLFRDARVHMYDTEQHLCNVARVVRRVHRLCGWDEHTNNERFKAFTLRTIDPDARFRFIVDSIKRERPQLAFIDGIADIINDFNNLEESSKCVNTLMALAADNNTCIICVLHINQKSKDNSALRGHLGTSITNKASDLFTAERDDTIFTVKHDISRNRTANDWCFTLDNDGIPQPTNTPLSKEESSVSDIQDKLRRILSDAPMRYSELVSKYEVLKGCSARTSKRHIALAIEHDFIKETNGVYSLCVCHSVTLVPTSANDT